MEMWKWWNSSSREEDGEHPHPEASFLISFSSTSLEQKQDRENSIQIPFIFLGWEINPGETEWVSLPWYDKSASYDFAKINKLLFYQNQYYSNNYILYTSPVL